MMHLAKACIPSMKQMLNPCILSTHNPATTVAHGQLVTGSRQITGVKQRRARLVLVLGWVTAAQVTLPDMC